MPRRLLILIAFLLLTATVSIIAAVRVSHIVPAYLPYNCIINGERSIKLNTHLYFNVPHTFAAEDPWDGNYTLQGWGIPQQKMIRILDNRTGNYVVLQSGIADVKYVFQWWWSPDSRHVFYGWQNYAGEAILAISSFDGEHSAIIGVNVWTGAWPEALSFSADSEYLFLLAVDNSKSVFVSTHDFQYRVIPLDDKMPKIGYFPQWSPTGHRLAYTVHHQLIVVEPDSGTFGQATSSTAPGTEGLASIEWSADQKYLAVGYYNAVEDGLIDHIFAVNGVTLTPIETFKFHSEAQRNFYYSPWSKEGHLFVYLRHHRPAFAVPSAASMEDLPADLWVFDPATHQKQILVSNILAFSTSNDDLMTLVRSESGKIVVEKRGDAGITLYGTWTLPENSLAWCNAPQATCWDTLARRLESDTKRCDLEHVKATFSFDNLSGAFYWSSHMSPGSHIISMSETPYQNCRFLARSVQSGDHTRVEIGDLQTDTVYRFPEAMNDTLPPQIRSPQNTTRWQFIVSPSSNEQVWLVMFSDKLDAFNRTRSVYLFSPALNSWKLVTRDTAATELDRVTWSPDNQRVMWTQGWYGSSDPNLFVAEADGSHLWNLGYFPTFQYLTWDKCGGIEAVLRGN